MIVDGRKHDWLQETHARRFFNGEKVQNSQGRTMKKEKEEENKKSKNTM